MLLCILYKIFDFCHYILDDNDSYHPYVQFIFCTGFFVILRFYIVSFSIFFCSVGLFLFGWLFHIAILFPGDVNMSLCALNTKSQIKSRRHLHFYYVSILFKILFCCQKWNSFFTEESLAWNVYVRFRFFLRMITLRGVRNVDVELWELEKRIILINFQYVR